MTARACEVCGEPGEPMCADPEDPWPLCLVHAAEVERKLRAASNGPTYSWEEVLASMPFHRRWALNVLRALRRVGLRR